MNPFQIMCEPIRRRILEVLASGEHPAGMIVDVITMEFAVKRSSVFWHLAILGRSTYSRLTGLPV